MDGMGWLFGNRKNPPAPPEEPPSGPRQEVHASPALEALVERLRRCAPPSILDLGRAVGSNVEFLSRFAARLSIADLHGTLTADESLAIRFQDQPSAVLPEVLPALQSDPGAPEGRHDVVLAWDLFNYLTRDQLDALGEVLTRLTRPGAHLLALVATAPEIPAEPVVYTILTDGRLRYTVHCPRPRKSPRWAPAELGRSLSGFTVDRSYLLRHGIQEYLMLRREEG